MACGSPICCNTHGNIIQDDKCVYAPGGITNLWFGNLCEILEISEYNGVFLGASQQPPVPPPTLGDDLSQLVELLKYSDDFRIAVYQDQAIADIIMKSNTSGASPGSPVNFPWWNIQCAPYTAGLSVKLVGGGGGNTALFWTQTLTFSIRRTDQYAINRIEEMMAGGRTSFIVQTAGENYKLGKEVAQVTGLPYVGENYYYLCGQSVGYIGQDCELKFGPSQTDPSMFIVTLTANETGNPRQIVPTANANYNTTSAATPGKYLENPFINAATNYGASTPTCNLINKLIRGDADA